MSTRSELEAAVAVATQALQEANMALAAFVDAPENNVFLSLAEAAAAIEDKLLDQASKDCEGAHRCGNEAYTQEFIVGGVKYLGTLSVGYNRHDKTYYYVDWHSFQYKFA
jgi:hypothetical protein